MKRRDRIKGNGRGQPQARSATPPEPQRKAVPAGKPHDLRQAWGRTMMTLLVAVLLSVVSGWMLYLTTAESNPGHNAARAGVALTASAINQAATSSLPQDSIQTARWLGFLHAAGLAMAIPYYYWMTKLETWCFSGERPAGLDMLMSLSTMLVFLNCLFLTMHFAYEPFINWMWEAFGGQMVSYQNIPSARSHRSVSAVGSAYRDGQTIALPVILAGAALWVKLSDMVRTRKAGRAHERG